MGNGWVGSHLVLHHPDTSYQFTHTGGFDDIYTVGLTAPDPIMFKFFIMFILIIILIDFY